ncbi:hypothetical protein BB8028_0005g09840 [Beauveria bassiana]|uniref:Uncharacterized protein n=1 Tax=Beauveria bassiana TaxID=176275 RepID=A0A2S7YH07_BEABA|nr:hypothetical protein BB8028_0005g09840 [Beauveria bassiana]
MKILTSFALFAAAATALPTEEQPVGVALGNDTPSYAHDVLARLEMLSWDRSQPPKYTTDEDWQPICFDNWFFFTHVQFWEEMWILADRPMTKKAFYIPHIEAAAINTGRNKDMALEITSSTTSTKTETKGWSIGAKIIGNFGKKDVAAGAVEVSASYSDTKTTTNSDTKTVAYKGVCEPGYECRIETWSFHLNLNAVAGRDMFFQQWGSLMGYETKELCSMHFTVKRCEQFTMRFDQNCQESSPGSRDYTLINKTKDVQLTVPIKEENGWQPMSRVVLVSEPLTAKKARAELEQSSIGTKETVMKSIEQGTKYQFLDGQEE